MVISAIITAAIAAALICAFCVRVIRLDKRRDRVKSYILVPCYGDLSGLEMIVKSAYWEEVFSSSQRARDIILLVEPDSEGEEKALMLEEKYSIVRCVKTQELESFVRK